jgi:two-component system nitrogen regulation response regulator NtrX
MSRLLVVDDVPAMAEQYAYDLRRLGGHEVAVAASGDTALEVLDRGDIECVILDLEMPGMDGFQVLERLRHAGLDTPVIVYTGTGDFDRCARAIRLGAAGFIDKAESMERVAQEVENAIERQRLRREVFALQRRLGESALLGRSRAVAELREAATRLAAIPSTVLILGESGTGKELVARELHRLGRNPAGPFVAINCAALPEQLVESELFGHRRGAFTGAVADRKGAFEMAAGGTLFLDEVGDLPLPAQAKLLRVLESREVQPLGAPRAVVVDVRVVAATNRDLDAEARAGGFRDDLFHRLGVHVLHVPPLRERREDILLLAEWFLDETCRRFGVLPRVLSGEARALLMAHDWRRNNVRELRNAVERMVVSTDGETLRAEHVPPNVRGHGAAGNPGQTFLERKAEAERRIVLAALERCEWHVTRTAESLGLADHASLLKIMRRLGIRRE